MASGTQHATEQLDQVIVRFAGDSGDGMQLTGDRFTTSSALLGNDLSTFPDFPAEIRAPAGTLNGVSAFQVHISDHDILTPGDSPNVLVAMNPAALKANIDLMAKGTMLIVNSDAFEERNLAKAGYDDEPADRRLARRLHGLRGPHDLHHPGGLQGGGRQAPRRRALQELLRPRAWSAGSTPGPSTRPSSGSPSASAPSPRWPRPTPGPSGPATTSARRPSSSSPTTRSARPPSSRASTSRSRATRPWPGASSPPSRLAGLPLFLGSYPITPASDILHELSRRKEFGVRTFQAEDEIAGIGAALGASFGGALGVTTTSGPGLDLKSETIGLAINLELPLVIVDVQRGGPSTGLPTKTEQADLLHAMYGRHGEAPLPIVAPADAERLLRRRHRGRPPGRQVPHAGHRALRRLPGQRGRAVAAARPRHASSRSSPTSPPSPTTSTRTATPTFWPYIRDPETLARPGPRPGLPGLEHRIGGLEKADGSGNVSYEGVNHERMVHLRQDKIAGIAADIPPVEVNDETGDAQLLLVSWGSTYAAVAAGRQAGAGPGHEGGPRPPAPPQPAARPTWARCWAATPRCWCPRSTWAS